MEKNELILDGLDCAYCAEKIVDAISADEAFNNVKFNFVSKRLIFYTYEKDKRKSKNKIKMIVDSIEDGVTVKQYNPDDVAHDQWIVGNVARIVVCIILAVLSLLIKPGISRLLLQMCAYFIVGYDVIIKALKNVFKGKALDENFLMTTATIGAVYLGKTSEAVAVMLFYQVGETFKKAAVKKSRKSITSLMQLKAEWAYVKKDNNIIQVKPEDVVKGDIIVIKPGEKVPLDGKIFNGETTVDTKSLTGETMPLYLKNNDEIKSGCINLSSVIEVVVTKEYCDSTVYRILELVESQGEKKAKTENFITRFAKVYTPIVVAVAAVIAFIIPLLFDNNNFGTWVYRGLIFLVVSCPCALVLSVPLSFFGGIGGASKKGILIKGASVIENLARLKTVAFDKTGTLTTGEFKVSLVCSDKLDKDEFIKVVATIESMSNHPLAKAIVRYYNKGIDKSVIRDVKEIPGKGVIAVYNNKKYFAGNKQMMDDIKIAVPDGIDASVVFISDENGLLGYITLADEIKNGTRIGINKLVKSNITNLAMITGDKSSAALKVADKLKINKVYSELLPHEKCSIVEKLMSEKEKNTTVAFVGDGMNDAPVLARADIGIAMGAIGSDTAIEASDVVLMTDEIGKVADAVKISKKTVRIVYQNIAFALFVKFAVLILAAFGLSSMGAAIFADVGVTVIAVINALRAMRVK